MRVQHIIWQVVVATLALLAMATPAQEHFGVKESQRPRRLGHIVAIRDKGDGLLAQVQIDSPIPAEGMPGVGDSPLLVRQGMSVRLIITVGVTGYVPISIGRVQSVDESSKRCLVEVQGAVLKQLVENTLTQEKHPVSEFLRIGAEVSILANPPSPVRPGHIIAIREEGNSLLAQVHIDLPNPEKLVDLSADPILKVRQGMSVRLYFVLGATPFQVFIGLVSSVDEPSSTCVVEVRRGTLARMVGEELDRKQRPVREFFRVGAELSLSNDLPD